MQPLVTVRIPGKEGAHAPPTVRLPFKFPAEALRMCRAVADDADTTLAHFGDHPMKFLVLVLAAALAKAAQFRVGDETHRFGVKYDLAEMSTVDRHSYFAGLGTRLVPTLPQ